jgi:hypothetical protein
MYKCDIFPSKKLKISFLICSEFGKHILEVSNSFFVQVFYCFSNNKKT